MARWEPKPTDKIGANEYVGRRLFRHRPLKGAKDQVAPAGMYELRHFEEKRDPGEISLDRLGRTSVEKKVKNYLEPLAQAAGETLRPPAAFDGWAVAKVNDLESPPPTWRAFKVIPSPVQAEPERQIEANAYHAHVERLRDGDYVFSHYDTALALREIFQRNFHHERPLHVGDAPQGFWRKIWNSITEFLQRKLAR